MEIKPLHILLADDDLDDCELFQAALKETAIPAELTLMDDGVNLMRLLNQPEVRLPDVLFLDVYMPRKNGLECLIEIKGHPDLQSLPVIILSQTINPMMVDALYENGALYYLQKPAGFRQQIRLIEKLLRLPDESKRVQPPKKDFVISVE
ncbi:response regulator [Runella sp.]|uniref:response regulator n=1 Tax=Runella sp. TaxID=1960881 RepID=UPI003D0DD12A